MLEERVARWPKQWLEEGRQKGLEQGLEQGLRKGKVELLKDQASYRFGELPEWAVERLDRADVDTLGRWSSRLLEATRLEGIFDDDPK